jgi:hypothetical protein
LFVGFSDIRAVIELGGSWGKLKRGLRRVRK